MFLQFEFNAMFAYAELLRLPVLTALWCALSAYFLWRFLAGERSSPVFYAVASAALAIAVLKLITLDLVSWDVCERLIYDAPYRWADAGVRLLDWGLVLAAFGGMYAAGRGCAWSARTAPLFGYSSLALLFLYASLETHTFLYWRLRAFQQGGISILWSFFAIAFIVGGIARSLRALRYLGLALFAVVAAKVLLFDLAGMEVIYRVIAFMVIGLILMFGSFAYIRSSRKFVGE
jgi:uncharacterized membrane protein